MLASLTWGPCRRDTTRPLLRSRLRRSIASGEKRCLLQNHPTAIPSIATTNQNATVSVVKIVSNLKPMSNTTASKGIQLFLALELCAGCSPGRL